MHKVLILSTINGIAARNCLSGIFKIVNCGLDWSIRFIESPDDNVLRMLSSPKPDGIIVSLDRRNDLLPQILSSDLPVVMIHDKDNSAPENRKNFVLIKNDDLAVGRYGAQYLSGRGQFASYVYIPTENRTSWSIFRERGFRLELGRRKIIPHTWDRSRIPLAKFLQQLPQPIAVLGATDTDSMPVIEACRSAHLKIPSQVAIVSVDDDEMLCESTKPQLSSIRTDDIRIGEIAAETLEQMMNNAKGHLAPKVIQVKPSSLTERNSTRSIPPAGHLIQEAQRFIRTNIADGVTVNDVVRHLRVSSSLLRTRFTEILGTSVRDTILDARLALVKRKLRQTSEPFSLIAKTCGFASLSHLSHFFRKKTGMTPGEFRSFAKRKPRVKAPARH